MLIIKWQISCVVRPFIRLTKFQAGSTVYNKVLGNTLENEIQLLGVVWNDLSLSSNSDSQIRYQEMLVSECSITLLLLRAPLLEEKEFTKEFGQTVSRPSSQN